MIKNQLLETSLMLQPLPVAWSSVEFSPERSGQNDSAYKNGIGIDTRDGQHLRLP